MVQSRTARCAFQSPHLTHRTTVWAVIMAYARQAPPSSKRRNTDHRGRRKSSSRIDFAPPMCALPYSTPKAGGPMSRFSGADAVPTTQGEVMGKLDGKVAVITGGS